MGGVSPAGSAQQFPPIGQVYSLLGAAIKNAYGTSTPTQGPAFGAGRKLVPRIRFVAVVTLAAGSTVTAVTLKLQHRYNDARLSPAAPSAWMDLPTNLDDVAGAAQPKGSTREIEHVISALSAPQVAPLSFYLDLPYGLLDLAFDAHADQVGHANDSIVIYASAPPL